MTRKIAQLGLFLALALILAYVESLIPFSFGIPGIKLGLPNLIVVMLLCGGLVGRSDGHQNDVLTNGTNRNGAKEALLVNSLRIVLSGFLFSNLYTIFYALAGALLSFIAMLIGRRMGCFSVVGVSVLGGVFHNIGQILVAMFVVETVYVGYYVPVLIVAGTVTGAVLGIAAMELMPYVVRFIGYSQPVDF
ncbi:MAG: Gx transporter family protein [Lachnospiraceae bacterium]|nr:Gx transporter family protein [Lachnospiraceae bacterium]